MSESLAYRKCYWCLGHHCQSQLWMRPHQAHMFGLRFTCLQSAFSSISPSRAGLPVPQQGASIPSARHWPNYGHWTLVASITGSLPVLPRHLGPAPQPPRAPTGRQEALGTGAQLRATIRWSTRKRWGLKQRHPPQTARFLPFPTSQGDTNSQ